MPSSIRLNITFGQCERDLRSILPEEPWQDLMKGIEFTSPKPVMIIEDIAQKVENQIEQIWWQRYGDEWGQLQVQVFKVMDQNGTKEYGFRDPVADLRPDDTLLMEVQTNQEWQQQQDKPRFTEEMIEHVRTLLRFDLNDRVLCFCGPRWLSGHIVGTAVVDDDDFLPYLVKTDALPGLPARTISVPTDKDHCCTQEVCFDPIEQLDLVRCAASTIKGTKKPKLRFAVGDKVVCRIKSSPEDGLEVWVAGFVSETWPSIGDASWDMGPAAGKFPDVVPYKVDFSSGSGKWVYCHRDDHTLIRREGMQPQTRVKGTSKRMEVLKESDGVSFRIDHVTERRKRMLEEVESD